MEKTLIQIQEENRKAIIMAAHPECKSYEEALEKELGFVCKSKKNYYVQKNLIV